MTMFTKLYRWQCSLTYTDDSSHQPIQYLSLFELKKAPKKPEIFAITLVIKLYKKRKIYPTTCISMFTKLYKKQISLNYTNDRVHQPIQML